MVLRKPRILLLDEPTEGLAHETAETVLARLRTAFPDAAILIAAHRPEEREWAETRSVTRLELENIQAKCADLT